MRSIFSDFDAAIKQMEKNPVSFSDRMNEAIIKQEKGAHRTRYKALALGVGIVRRVGDYFPMFEKLRDKEWLKGNRRIQKATEDNFEKLVAQAAALRIFGNTEADDYRISVYHSVMKYFVDKEIEISDIPSEIKSMGGIEGVYKQVKKDNALNRGKRKLKKAKRTSMKESASNSGRDETATDSEEWSDAEEDDERKHTSKKSSRVADKLPAVKTILASHLLIALPSDELDQYLDPRLHRGQRYELEVVFRGRDEEGLYRWEYVYGRKKVTSSHTDDDSDNDNEADWEDEVA